MISTRAGSGDGDRRYGTAWLDEFAAMAMALETVAATADGNLPVTAVPEWTITGVIAHLGEIHRVVAAMIQDGRPPATPVVAPTPHLVHAWYAEGWRRMHQVLAALPADTPVATWSATNPTMAFWRRRMVHEIAIHALDVFDAVGEAWTVADHVALDGIEELLITYLVDRLGTRAAAAGGTIDVRVGGRHWLVRLGPRIEVTRPDRASAGNVQVTGDPAAVYAWLWHRRAPASAGRVVVTGDPAVVTDLRRCVTLAVA